MIAGLGSCLMWLLLACRCCVVGLRQRAGGLSAGLRVLELAAQLQHCWPMAGVTARLASLTLPTTSRSTAQPPGQSASAPLRCS